MITQAQCCTHLRQASVLAHPACITALRDAAAVCSKCMLNLYRDRAIREPTMAQVIAMLTLFTSKLSLKKQTDKRSCNERTAPTWAVLLPSLMCLACKASTLAWKMPARDIPSSLGRSPIATAWGTTTATSSAASVHVATLHMRMSLFHNLAYVIRGMYVHSLAVCTVTSQRQPHKDKFPAWLEGLTLIRNDTQRILTASNPPLTFVHTFMRLTDEDNMKTSVQMFQTRAPMQHNFEEYLSLLVLEICCHWHK